MRALRARYRKIEEIVTDLLGHHDGVLPIDVFALAGSLGVEIRISNLGSLSMVMRRQEGGAIVVVDRGESILRQRFAISHALGHVVLHPEIVEHADRRFLLLGRNRELAPDKSVQEKEANYFAAILLIPKSILIREMKRCPHDEFDEIDIRALADEFHVSANLMLVRLCGMENQFNVVPVFL